MLKRTLTIFTLAICGFMSTQATVATSSQSEQEQHGQFASCGKGGCGKGGCGKGKVTFTTEQILVGCSKCKDKRLA